MTQAIKYGTRLLPADGAAFPVPPPSGPIEGERVDLVFNAAFRLAVSGAPVYRFDILDKEGMWAGVATLVADPDIHDVYLIGHIGCDFSEQLADARSIGEVVKLLQPLARRNGMSRILITSRLGNRLVRQVCEDLGAETLAPILDPQGLFEGQRTLVRYVIAV
jgi:hypothetical protein